MVGAPGLSGSAHHPPTLRSHEHGRAYNDPRSEHTHTQLPCHCCMHTPTTTPASRQYMQELGHILRVPSAHLFASHGDDDQTPPPQHSTPSAPLLASCSIPVARSFPYFGLPTQSWMELGGCQFYARQWWLRHKDGRTTVTTVNGHWQAQVLRLLLFNFLVCILSVQTGCSEYSREGVHTHTL